MELHSENFLCFHLNIFNTKSIFVIWSSKIKGGKITLTIYCLLNFWNYVVILEQELNATGWFIEGTLWQNMWRRSLFFWVIMKIFNRKNWWWSYTIFKTTHRALSTLLSFVHQGIYAPKQNPLQCQGRWKNNSLRTPPFQPQALLVTTLFVVAPVLLCVQQQHVFDWITNKWRGCEHSSKPYCSDDKFLITSWKALFEVSIFVIIGELIINHLRTLW